MKGKSEEADLEIKLAKTKILIKTATEEDKDRTIDSKDDIATVTQSTYLGQKLSFSNRIEKEFNSRIAKAWPRSRVSKKSTFWGECPKIIKIK